MALKLKTTKKTSDEAKKPSFLKTGKAAATSFKEEEAKAEAAKDQAGKLWRFRINKDNYEEEFRITFLDGEINEFDLLDTPSFYEHTIFFNGKWQNFVAPEDEEDPIAEQHDRKADFVQAFTVIDHTPFTRKDGTKIKASKKLFICKRTTLKLLTNIAKKRGGLTGASFDVMRSGDKSPAVGDNFDFVEKKTLQELAKEYGEDLASPADYAEEIPYYTRSELLEMGIGSKASTISAGSVDEDDLDDNL